MQRDKAEAHVAYLKTAAKLPIIPSPMGVVSHKGDYKTVNLTDYSMGDQQAKAFGEAMKLSEAECLKLKNNRLTIEGAVSIISNLN